MNFDRIAPFYQMLEFFGAGRRMQRCRAAFLSDFPPPRGILLVGEGPGSFLEDCIRNYPEARILVVDSSAEMLRIARGKVPSERVEFIHADFLDWEGPQGSFDFIATNFFLDCFMGGDLVTAVSKLGKLAAPRADWFLADFAYAPGGFNRWRSHVIVGMLYRFFRIVTGLKADKLEPTDEEIIRAGFVLHRRKTYERGLLKCEWWKREL